MRMTMGSYNIGVKSTELILFREEFSKPLTTKIVCTFNFNIEVSKMSSNYNKDIAAVEYILKKATDEKFKARLQQAMIKINKIEEEKKKYRIRDEYGYDYYDSYDSY